MKNNLLGIVLLVCLVILGVLPFTKGSQKLGTVSVSNECYATTTPTGFDGTLASGTVIRYGTGALCSVVVSGMRTGNFFLYDATTTNVNLRTGTKATSSILLAEIPAGAASSTYQYDVTFNSGLLFVGVGNVPTSTITSR